MAKNTLIYTTGAMNTVVIDYDATMELFLTDGEKVPFTAERIVRMLNMQALRQRVYQTVVGRLQVVVGGVSLELTQRAVSTIAHLYCQRRDWQIEYPTLGPVFAAQGEGVAP